MNRGDPWPKTLDDSRAFMRRMQKRYTPLVSNLHTLDLLGLNEAVVAEMKTRNELGGTMEAGLERGQSGSDISRAINAGLAEIGEEVFASD